MSSFLSLSPRARPSFCLFVSPFSQFPLASFWFLFFSVILFSFQIVPFTPCLFCPPCLLRLPFVFSCGQLSPHLRSRLLPRPFPPPRGSKTFFLTCFSPPRSKSRANACGTVCLFQQFNSAPRTSSQSFSHIAFLAPLTPPRFFRFFN